MSPEQELYDRLYIISQNELGYYTYEQLPRLDATYPFVELAETQNVSNDIKNSRQGQVTQTINFWGSEDMRYQLIKMMEMFLFERVRTDSYVYVLDHVEKRILPDSSVPNTRLFHGVLTLVFNYQERT